jgi:uncharacterized protein (UPF0297 family)
VDETRKFQFQLGNKSSVKQILTLVYHSLEEKGYNPINQIVGYLISGDPAYIPRHNHARALIKSVDRDDIIEELVKSYLDPDE